jgi:hypothetical protein
MRRGLNPMSQGFDLAENKHSRKKYKLRKLQRNRILVERKKRKSTHIRKQGLPLRKKMGNMNNRSRYPRASSQR